MFGIPSEAIHPAVVHGEHAHSIWWLKKAVLEACGEFDRAELALRG
ncbi:MAG TPA: hypothetical protein VLA61_19915 [Ideonella sp.]|nr:hypothetical protein [Ideonella sp.]HSI50540.1 hypothetical protein [Ideonella sp.]